MHRTRNVCLSLALLAAAAGCSDPAPKPIEMPGGTPGPTVPIEALPNIGHSHDDALGDPFADARALPPAESARVHVCGKLRFDVLGATLASRGVNLTAPTAAELMNPSPALRVTARYLYHAGAAVLGQPDYRIHVAENTSNTTGGLIRFMDVLIAAADELIANLPQSSACKGLSLFNMDGSCNGEGFGCLIGAPFGGPELALCNTMVKDGGFTTPDAARRLAVAAIAGTTLTCD